MVVVHIQASTNMVHLGSDLKDEKTFFLLMRISLITSLKVIERLDVTSCQNP